MSNNIHETKNLGKQIARQCISDLLRTIRNSDARCNKILKLRFDIKLAMPCCHIKYIFGVEIKVKSVTLK